jgi:hypothetical protein
VAFFKMASDKNDAFTGKGPSAETTAREEREVAARVEREERHIWTILFTRSSARIILPSTRSLSL